jgi:hypothetical protein
MTRNFKQGNKKWQSHSNTVGIVVCQLWDEHTETWGAQRPVHSHVLGTSNNFFKGKKWELRYKEVTKGALPDYARRLKLEQVTDYAKMANLDVVVS